MRSCCSPGRQRHSLPHAAVCSAHTCARTPGPRSHRAVPQLAPAGPRSEPRPRRHLLGLLRVSPQRGSGLEAAELRHLPPAPGRSAPCGANGRGRGPPAPRGVSRDATWRPDGATASRVLSREVPGDAEGGKERSRPMGERVGGACGQGGATALRGGKGAGWAVPQGGLSAWRAERPCVSWQRGCTSLVSLTNQAKPL